VDYDMTKPWMTWTGRVFSAIAVLMMGMSGVMKVAHAASVVQGFGELGIPEYLIIPIGIIELTCVVVYVVPRTALLGAVLIAGYLGGAVLTSLRVGQAPTALAPFILGIMAMGGVWMREPRLRALLPVRRELAAGAQERSRSRAAASGNTATPLGSR
jgi:hypothetical protein